MTPHTKDIHCGRSPQPLPPQPVSTTYEASLQVGASCEVGIVRRLTAETGQLAVLSTCAWTVDDRGEAERQFRWMSDRRDLLPRLGRLSLINGPHSVLAIVAEGVRLDREREIEEDMLAELRAEQDARLHGVVESFVFERGGRFGLNLKRASDIDPVWEISFRERWERERFRDWFRCQDHRFAEWADHADGHRGRVLERLLLAEMLETEKRVKVAGLGAGGRRPLRFYRGEQ